MVSVCAFCEDPIESGEGVEIEERDDPLDNFDDDAVAHGECLRRHRAAVEQARRMFRRKPEGPHQSEPPREIDEEELDEEIAEIEAQLEEQFER